MRNSKPPPRPKRSEGHPISILLVEDNIKDVELITEALSDSDLKYHLDVARDGEEALRFIQLKKDKPNIILLDLNLPKKSGFDVLKDIKENPSLKTIPVVVLTNSRAENDVFKAYSLHANGYVRKPLGYEPLVEAIKVTSAFWCKIATLP